MLVKKVRVDGTGQIFVHLENKLQVTFESLAVAHKIAEEILQGLGPDGRAALALLDMTDPMALEKKNLANVGRSKKS